MKSGAPEYLPIMMLRPVLSLTTVTVIVTVTGMTTMPVLINEKLRML
jgi:hypothetical protein